MRFVTCITLPPRPPTAFAPNPSAVGKALTTLMGVGVVVGKEVGVGVGVGVGVDVGVGVGVGFVTHW